MNPESRGRRGGRGPGGDIKETGHAIIKADGAPIADLANSISYGRNRRLILAYKFPFARILPHQGL